MSDQLPYSERYRLIKLGLLPKEAVKKQPKPIAKKSVKKIAEEKEERASRVPGEETELTKWYRAKMKVADNCYWCGCKVEKHVFHYAKMSICHILEKNQNACPSVATHPLNFVILCPDHHKKFDSLSWEERERLGFWDTIRDRLIMMHDSIAPDEMRHFPQSVLDYMEKNEPF